MRSPSTRRWRACSRIRSSGISRPRSPRSGRPAHEHDHPVVERSHAAVHGTLVERLRLLPGAGHARVLRSSARREPARHAAAVARRQPRHGLQHHAAGDVSVVGAGGALARFCADEAARRGGDCRPLVRVLSVPLRAPAASRAAGRLRHAGGPRRAAPVHGDAPAALARGVRGLARAAGPVLELLPGIFLDPARTVAPLVHAPRRCAVADRHPDRGGVRARGAAAR